MTKLELTVPEMIDVVFDLQGVSVHEHYPCQMWSALVQHLPDLAAQPNTGVHPLRGSLHNGQLLLSRRSKLVLRVASELVNYVSGLQGKKLEISGGILQVGAFKTREIQPAPTLHAGMVESPFAEVEFIESMKKQLQEMDVACNLICDKYREIICDDKIYKGYGLVLHDLKPLASIKVQQTGLSSARHLGCGIFVPFKAITGLD